MTLLLLRHASAGDRAAWRGDDRERRLDPRGRRQAAALASTVAAAWPVTAVLSSPYRRCIETVEPLAAGFGLAVDGVADLVEGAGAEGCLGYAASAGSGALVLCTHGDVIIEVLAELVRLGVIGEADAARHQKAGLWELDAARGHIERAAYHPAPRG